MSLLDPLQTLRDNRAALLTCEAIGWLHMAGKAHPDFVKQQAHDYKKTDKRWDELTWASNLITRFGAMPSLGAQSIRPQQLFERHQKSDGNGVLGLLQAAHAMASGIEKGTPLDYQKQSLAQTWLTTAFGHPIQNLLGSAPPDILANGAWSNTEAQIGVILDGLAARAQNTSNLGEWRRWREEVIGPSSWLRGAFTATLAETRVPSNDVTLWDQSFIAAALFKAAAAGAALLGQSFQWENSKVNTRWRVLTVGIGAEHYEARAVRIGDWTGTRDEISAFFDDVSEFMEVDLALGACVYRDERALSFTFPGQRFDLEGGVDDDLASTLCARIGARVDELARARAFETPPLVRLSSSTRSFTAISPELAKARRVLEVPVHRSWSFAHDGSKGKHICPVTLVRAGEPSNNGGDQKQDVSKSAHNRRVGRRASWEKSGGDTIWISEVADENDRVALLTFSLGLEGWLDGSHVDSLRARSLVECRKNLTQFAAIDANTPRASFHTHVVDLIRKPTLTNGKLSDGALESLNPGFKHALSPKDFFEKIVEDRSDAPSWDSLDDSSRAAWLTHQLFRKNASPGRIHRFWRTTRAFFAEALGEFRTLVAGTGGTRTQRMSLTISGGTNLRIGEVYAGRLPSAPNAPFEILCRTNDWVTVCNLERVLGPRGDVSQLKGVPFEARSDDGVRHQFTIVNAASSEGTMATYCPLIVLEENPERFRVMVPLSAEAACVEHVVSKWRKEMARVWDRLPLRVGTIAFPRKTPFQAVIEATRNVEDDLMAGGAEKWCVKRVATEKEATRIKFERPDKKSEEVNVPTLLASGCEDVYYPNFAVTGVEREPHDFTAPRRSGSSVVYRRAADLKTEDEVYIEPSRFASLFLDSTARRFEPAQVYPLSEWERHRELWNQIGKVAPSHTAAHAVESSLREAREQWTDANGTLNEAAWSVWVRAVLANEWHANERDLNDLEAAARDGLLERVLSWHLHVLQQTTGATHEQ